MLKKKHYNLEKMKEPINLIIEQNTPQLVTKYNDHPLNGDRQGQRSLHIEKNWVLIYELAANKNEIILLTLIVTGSHDDVYRRRN
jgi:mRNA interferase YafQ